VPCCHVTQNGIRQKEDTRSRIRQERIRQGSRKSSRTGWVGSGGGLNLRGEGV